jgi:hypothetical protein
MPEVGNFPESRMREIFTSGSSRGEWVAPLAESPSLLLYRHAACHGDRSAAEEGRLRLPQRYLTPKAVEHARHTKVPHNEQCS